MDGAFASTSPRPQSRRMGRLRALHAFAPLCSSLGDGGLATPTSRRWIFSSLSSSPPFGFLCHIHFFVHRSGAPCPNQHSLTSRLGGSAPSLYLFSSIPSRPCVSSSFIPPSPARSSPFGSAILFLVDRSGARPFPSLTKAGLGAAPLILSGAERRSVHTHGPPPRTLPRLWRSASVLQFYVSPNCKTHAKHRIN